MNAVRRVTAKTNKDHQDNASGTEERRVSDGCAQKKKYRNENENKEEDLFEMDCRGKTIFKKKKVECEQIENKRADKKTK